MERFDVAVIGAGPAGSMAAKYASKAGASTIMLEEHAGPGSPVQCAGLLGIKAIEESELLPGGFMIHGVKGASICSPGSKVSFKSGSWKAWVVDRRIFDREMALEALRNGSELRLKSVVRDVTRDHSKSTITLGSGRSIQADVVISAEGVKAYLARKAGIRPPEKVLSGAQVEALFSLDDPEKVEVHLGAAPGLFAWVIPAENGAARIGLCARENACDYLQTFLKKDEIRSRLLGSPFSLVTGGLPLGPPASAVADGFMAVGDAAGQVKPISGGGIYPGLVCAKIAGSLAAAASQEGDCSAKRLMEYDKRWRAAIGLELEIGMRVNRLMERMTKEDLDEVLGCFLRRKSLTRIIEQHGDIDRPSLLMARLLPWLGIDGIRLARLLRYALG